MITTCGTEVVHTTREVDAWVDDLMAGLEGFSQQNVTLIIGIILLIIITDSGIIRMGGTPEGQSLDN